MRKLVAIFASLMLLAAGTSMHGEQSFYHESAAQVADGGLSNVDCHIDASENNGSSIESADYKCGCTAGKCAMACGYFEPREMVIASTFMMERTCLPAGEQIAGIGTSFDPPPPRA